LAAKTILNNVFKGQSPRILQAKTHLARNQSILARYAEGSLMADLADDYGISHQRVYQIVYGQ
jgi:Mor family transcriptional regulator